MTSRPRKVRVGWVVIGGIVAVLIIGSIAATVVLRSGAGTAVTRPTPTPAASVSGGSTGANGCLAGPGITATQLEQVRARKDFTPTGAVEFLGAFTQFFSAGDPNYRVGIERVTAEMTAGNVQLALSSLKSSGSPDGGNTHASYLGQGYYHIVSATSKAVVVDLIAEQLRNGSPIPGDSGGSYYGGGSYTVEPTSAGWIVMHEAKPSQTNQELIDTGQRFEGGC